MNFARVTWFCPSGLPWLFSGLSSQVTISGMTITRGESNSDPQFHVMVSSIQAVRQGESLHQKPAKLVVFEMTQDLEFSHEHTYFTKLIPTFFCFFVRVQPLPSTNKLPLSGMFNLKFWPPWDSRGTKDGHDVKMPGTGWVVWRKCSGLDGCCFQQVDLGIPGNLE